MTEQSKKSKCYFIEELDNDFYKIENVENGLSTIISMKSVIDRTNAIGLIKNIGFEKEVFEKIWNEIMRYRQKLETFNINAAMRTFTDYLEMANEFVKRQPIFYTQQKLWWLWDFENYSWKQVDETDLLNKMQQATNGLHLCKPQVKAEIINALKMKGRLNVPNPAKNSWIQFKNKIIDIKTNEEFEVSPRFFVTNSIPWKLGSSENTPTIDKLFHDWVEEKYVRTLYEIIAFSMLPYYALHRVFCLNGEGRNGKSTFLKLLTNFLGSSNVCSSDFDTLVNRPFEAAKLYKKLVCIMGEINSSIFRRTSLFKKLTGEDMIGFEFKGKDSFDDKNYAKLIIATNKLPESTDKTIGFFSRWLIIDFNNIFTENPHLLDIVPNEEYENLAFKSIKILKEVLSKGKFTNEGDLTERELRYEERATPFKDFIKKRCEISDANAKVPFWEIYEEYCDYLNMRNFRTVSKRELSNLLKNRGYEIKREHYTKNDGSDSTMRIVYGLTLISKLEEDKEEEKREENSGKNDKNLLDFL